MKYKALLSQRNRASLRIILLGMFVTICSKFAKARIYRVHVAFSLCCLYLFLDFVWSSTTVYYFKNHVAITHRFQAWLDVLNDIERTLEIWYCCSTFNLSSARIQMNALSIQSRGESVCISILVRWYLNPCWLCCSFLHVKVVDPSEMIFKEYFWS